MNELGLRKSISWNRQPLVRPLIALIAGFFIAEFIKPDVEIVLFLFVASIAFLLVHLRSRLNRALIGFVLTLGFLVLGCCLQFAGCYNEVTIPEHKNHVFLLKQLDVAVHKANNGEVRTTFLAESGCFLTNSTWRTSINCLRITVKDIQLNTPPGTIFLLHGVIRKPKNDLFPGSFDFETFCRRQSIDAVCSVSANRIRILQSSYSKKPPFVYRFRNWIIQTLKDAGFNQNQSSIAAALLIGSRAEIDPDLNRAYSRAGIVHVLAVSGMHVSLVFGSVLWILRRLLKQKPAVLIGICALWCYALLAGMSASVVRSAFMFTLLSGSKLFVNSSLSCNSLAGAALIMIGIDPNYLFDPGAQLSFAAVWGIQARSKLPHFLLYNNRILKFISESLWICLIAQFATLPLTLSYFGTFPVYFMLANLVAVPLSTALIYIGFAALLLAPFGFLSTPLFALMAFAIDWLNTFTLFVASLPYSAYNGGALGFGSSICIALFVYIVLLPFGRFYTKFLLITILRIIFVGLFLINTRLVYPPQVFLSRCEKHTHIHASYRRSARSAVFGSLDESSCKRVDDMKTHAAQFGLDLVSSKFTTGHHAGLVSIFIWNNRIVQKQSVVLLPANNILISPSISKYSWLICESTKSKLPNLIYSRLYRRPIQRFDLTKTNKIW